jgi:hypothetical protein
MLFITNHKKIELKTKRLEGIETLGEEIDNSSLRMQSQASFIFNNKSVIVVRTIVY